MAVSTSLRKKILERDNYTCVVCREKYRPAFLHIDHKFPSSKGGTDDEWNLRVLCAECNMKKSSTAPECPNCHKAVDPSQPACPNCNYGLYFDKSRAKQSKGSISPLARRLLLALAVVMIVFGLGSMLLGVVSNLWNRAASTVTGTPQSIAAGTSCSISDGSGKANLKNRCDSLDCDSDPATVSGKINSGTTVVTTGKVVNSTLPSVGQWIETTVNGQSHYIASTKLVCR